MNKNKSIRFFGILVICGLVLSLGAIIANAQTAAAGSEDAQDAPAGVTSTGSTGTAEDGGAGVISNTSSHTAQDNQAGVTSNPGTHADQDSFPGSNGSNDGGNNNGGNNPGGSGTITQGSGPSGTTSVGGTGFGGGTAITGTTTTICPLITTYLKFGSEINSKEEVSKLQAFLKNAEKLDVDVNGTFDNKTLEAVKAFQKKYSETVLGPWSATRATGFVYITTIKKINQLACSQPLQLTAEEIAIIEAYKTRGGSALTSSTDGNDILDSTTSSTSLEVGDTSDDSSSNTAAANRASIVTRFWDFIKNLFVRLFR